LRWLAVGFVSILLTTGCMGGAFDQARREDTAAAYHGYLREHPDSRHADEARQRMALVRLRSKPSAAGWDEFVKEWPQSPLLPRLRPLVEEAVFERARAMGSVKAYRGFLEEFGSGAFAARARGNLAYLEEQGIGGRPDALEAFAEAYPESDFAAEAARTAASLIVRGSSSFRQVGLLVALSASTPGKQRLARVFTERAAESLRGVGVQVVPLASADDPRGGSLEVRLSIRHEEGPVASELTGGTVRSGGILAKTTVTLAERGVEEPIWSRTTSFKAPAPAALADTSVLFAPGTERYWSAFFVPVATWNTRAAVRPPTSLEGRLVAVESQGARGFALYGDGTFEVLELSDPENPWVFAAYARPRDLATFSGLRLVGDRAVIFGQDGLEIVALGAGVPKLQRAVDRGAVGSVVAVEPLSGGLAVASQRGLFFVPDGGKPELVLDRAVRGMASSGDRLIFTDGGSVFVSTLALLRGGRVEGDLPLGPGVRPHTIRAAGKAAIVLTDVGALRLDLSNPSAPRLASRIDASEVGALQDVAVAGGRIFLLGERGLQVSDSRGSRVVQSADVAARSSLDPMGRHLVMVGERYVQVVDTTPFVAPASLGAPPTDEAPASHP
jgi:hypothetical protein